MINKMKQGFSLKADKELTAVNFLFVIAL